MKKILIITDNLPDQINGVVTTFKNIEEHAFKDGYSFVFITPKDFRHIDCPGYPEVKLSFPWKIWEKIKSENADYVHIATEGPIGFFARIYLDVKNSPYNTSYHTKFPEFLYEMYRIPIRLSYAYMRWFHKHSGKVLTTTNSMVKDLSDRGFTNVISWTRGVNRNQLTPSGSRKQNSRPVVLSVGRISKEKGLDDLVFLQENYDIVVVGDGPYRKELERKLPTAQFVGYKIGSELADCYQQADVFVFTSKNDTFGLVMIEAMSQGTPVAAYPVRGPLDVIDQGTTGIYHEDLKTAVKQALELNRNVVKSVSMKWSWEECWKIFKKNLIKR